MECSPEGAGAWSEQTAVPLRQQEGMWAWVQTKKEVGVGTEGGRYSVNLIWSQVMYSNAKTTRVPPHCDKILTVIHAPYYPTLESPSPN